MHIRNAFRKVNVNRVTGNLKTNLQRVRIKVKQCKPPEEGAFRVTDMIRATVILYSIDQLQDAYL